ncbi:T-cell surface glycoprotein CD3 delta chain [Chaetodon auriga]|uniref:T-cell surface glycoprotein CD3 delta chain n=1 Tax=Chaetodon auriga TaxID=39042 RepID=UPI004032D799
MKCQKLLPASLLLLWTLTASVSCNDGTPPKNEIQVKTVSDGIVLRCSTSHIKNKTGGRESITLTYRDDNTGEYPCVRPDSDDPPEGDEPTDLPKIFVKFRTCDNCVELDLTSIVGLAIGNMVATVVIGVAVYLLTSQTRISPTASHKKSSDRQHLVPNEMSSRAPNDHYQPLKHKGQRDTYDVLTNRR